MNPSELFARVQAQSARPLAWPGAPQSALSTSQVNPAHAWDFYQRAAQGPQAQATRMQQLQSAGSLSQDESSELAQLKNLQSQQQRLAGANTASQQMYGQLMASPQVFGTTLNSVPG